MFTGLVETTGSVSQATGESPRRLVIESNLPYMDIPIGASVSIDGCCLTVVARGSEGLAFEAATETLERTTIGNLAVGSRVNLERAMKLGDHLGGHIVLGHVDGVGKVTHKEQRGSALYVGILAPDSIAHLIASQGSVTVSGVSLTVTSVDGDTFFVGLIPHTLKETNLGDLEIGSPVNLEADVMARYVERLLQRKPELASGLVSLGKPVP